VTNTYLYNGSFTSFLALIVTLLNSKITPYDIKSESKYIPNLFDKPAYLKLDNKKEKINYLKAKLSSIILSRIYYVFLSSDKNKEMIIYDFIKNALYYRSGILYRRNIDSVNKVLKISSYVSKETHHMKGFLRFKKMKNFYYAKMEPTNNIIQLIANHFKKRLSNEYWIIHDEKRKIYAIYNLKNITYLHDENILSLNLNLADEENSIEDLWKTFFKTVAIKERENKKTQMNFMPKKYWKNIIEMEDRI